MHARIGAQDAVEKFVTVEAGVAKVGQQQPTAAAADALERLVGIGCCDRLVSEIVDQSGERVELRRIIVKNARSYRALDKRSLGGLGQNLSHVIG